jgi:hypothetical protein
MGNNLQPKDLPPYPLPPSDFSSRTLPVVASSGPFYRLNSSAYPSALHFDRSGCGRFDGANQPYGILYVGADEYAAFIEKFGRKHGRISVEEAALRKRSLFSISATRPLFFADLTGSGLVKMGADAQVTTGSYETARAWATAIFEHPQSVDGIRYFSRHDNTRLCFGIFDRVGSVIMEQDLDNLLDQHPDLLGKMLDHYGYGLI